MIPEEIKNEILEKLKIIEPLTPNQKKVVDVLNDERKDLVGIFGPTGSGKTFLILVYAIQSVLKDKYKKLVIIRALVNTLTRERVPTLEKEPIKKYIYDVLSRYLEAKHIDKLFEAGLIEVYDPFFLRGYSFDKSIVFVDDAHALTPSEMFEILMHMGIDSRFLFAADPVLQETIREDGARALRQTFEKMEEAAFVDLGIADIIRPGARRAVWLLLKNKMKLKPLTEEEKKCLEVIMKHAPDARVVTVLDLRKLKEEHEIKGETPDFLIVAEAGTVGRILGRGGRRIQAIEKELGARVRVIDFSPSEKILHDLFLAIHPVPGKLRRAIQEIDIRGFKLVVVVAEKVAGVLFGKGGSYVRLVEDAFMQLFGLPLVVETRS